MSDAESLQVTDADVALRELSASRKIDPVESWSGVPEDELRRFEVNIGKRLHPAYRRFLSQVGVSGARTLDDGSALFWPDPMEFAELIEEMGPVPFSDRCTPILVHQGYYVQWIDSESGNVLGWTEGDGPNDVVAIAPTFGDWLRRHLHS